MAYDLGKINALEAHRQIVDHISRQLAACSAFNNNSLSYFGLEIKYKIEIVLHSRGVGKESLSAAITIGGGPANPEVVRALEQEGVHAVRETLEVTDEQLAGTAARKVGTVESKKGTAARGDQASATVGQHGDSSRDQTAQRTDGEDRGPNGDVSSPHRPGSRSR